MTPHAHDCPAADRLVDDAIRAIGAEIDALRIPRLLGVVLGGGYARGEGGVILRASRASQVPSPKSQDPGRVPDGQPATCDLRPAPPAEPALSNDLDFYVVAEDGASPADLAAIAATLRPVSEKWTARLGVDVDFSPPKTPWRLRHDEERLMIQELVHGYFDVAGRPGEELFRGVARREPSALPAMEAVRLLVNRGAGLLLASAPGASPEFVARNINKAILGCGDARLIARGGYRWRAEERAEALCDPLYAAAVAWKFRPRPEPVCDWEKARDLWLASSAELFSDHATTGPSDQATKRPCDHATTGPCDHATMRPCDHASLRDRSLRAVLRWIARRRTLGAPRTLGMDPLVRILDELVPAVRDRRPFPVSLRRDWEVFN